jgi:nitrogen regulatory protein PII
MEAVKRVEIIVPEFVVADVTAALADRGLDAYTVVRGLYGRGDRGVQDGEGTAGAFSNAAVLVACPPGLAAELVDALRPLLRRFGGLCLVSDAFSVRH